MWMYRNFDLQFCVPGKILSTLDIEGKSIFVSDIYRHEVRLIYWYVGVFQYISNHAKTHPENIKNKHVLLYIYDETS